MGVRMGLLTSSMRLQDLKGEVTLRDVDFAYPSRPELKATPRGPFCMVAVPGGPFC